MGELLQGKEIAGSIKEEVAKEIASLGPDGRSLKLCAVLIGDDREASLYSQLQQRVAAKLGIGYILHKIPGNVSEPAAIQELERLNQDPAITGIIVQIPIPKHLDPRNLINHIHPWKDVEGLHPENMGRIVLDREHIVPCTPCAVMELLRSADISLYGKEAVVVGHSDIVGKPLALMLLNKGATVTICHIATAERGLLAEHIGRAEVLVVAVGKRNVIKGSWVRKGAVVIDVGITCTDGTVQGDVEFEPARERAAFITPVPGGVGPLTVALLMRNVVKASRLQQPRQ